MKKLAAALSVFLVTCALVACSNSNTPQTVAKQYIAAMYAGDVDAAFQLFYFTDADKKEIGVEDLMRGKIKAMAHEAKQSADAKGGVAKISTSEPSYSNEKKHAKVAVTIQFNNDESTMTTVRLIATDKGWLIRPRLL